MGIGVCALCKFWGVRCLKVYFPPEPKNSENPIAIVRDRRWPQKAKLEGNTVGTLFSCIIYLYIIYIYIYIVWKKRHERPNVGCVSTRSGSGAPSRNGCLINGQMATAVKEEINKYDLHQKKRIH